MRCNLFFNLVLIRYSRYDQEKHFPVSTYQGHHIPGNIPHNLDQTLEQLALAASKGSDVLCMPESFLHGYFEEREKAEKYSLDLESTDFSKLLENFKTFNTTLLLGPR